MRLGIHLPQYGRASGPDAIARRSRGEPRNSASPTCGSATTSSGLLVQDYPSAYLFDPLMTLAWAGAATERVGLGTSVMVVPQYHPLQLANALASLDQLSRAAA